MSSRILFAIALSACGCKTPTAPAVLLEDGAPCEIQLSVVREIAGDSWFLHAEATNQTSHALRLELEGQCPGGAVHFSGLGAGYDYYGTCALGPCKLEADPVIELPPGATVRLATAVVAPRGKGCQPALGAASYALQFEVPLKMQGARTCIEPLRIDHQLE